MSCCALLALSLGAACDKKPAPAPQAAATAASAAAPPATAPAAAGPAAAAPAAKEGEAPAAPAAKEGEAPAAPAAKEGEAPAAPAAEAATAPPTEPPTPAVAPEACQAACGNALKITLVELKDVKPAMRAAIEKKLTEDCPAQCGKSGTPESVACIAKATSAAELAACPK